MKTNETFTLSAIAKRLGLSAPTVSNWRNRYDDFPRPMETVGKRELWTLQQIQEFMKVRGLDGRERRPSALRPKERDYSSASGLVASLSEFLTPEEAILYLLAQAWNINKGASKPDLRNLATTLRDHPSLSPLSTAVTAALKSEQLSLLDAVQKGLSAILADKSRRLIFVSDVRIQWGQLGRDRAATTSPDRLSAVIASLASGKSVLELCAGLGSSLRHVKNAAQIVAQEIDPIALPCSRFCWKSKGWAPRFSTKTQFPSFTETGLASLISSLLCRRHDFNLEKMTYPQMTRAGFGMKVAEFVRRILGS